MTPDEMKAFIWSRCTPCGKCLLWDGAVANGGVPVMHAQGSKRQEGVRRVLLKAMGVDVEGKVATTTCDNPLCMAEKHVVAWTRKRLQKRSGMQLSTNLARSAKLAAVRRKSAVLTIEKAREMRASGMNGEQAAKHYGVSESAAYKVLAGTTWKEYGSPFAALGRQA